MRIESKLCHISDDKAVVQVNAWLNEKKLGSSLAEASTVEIAEDKAIERLFKRLNNSTNNQKPLELKNINEIKSQVNVELPKNKKIETVSTNKEPNDWSDELISIDREIERLNWSREQEIKFLVNNLGINSRSKITKYNDLIKYLSILKKIDNLNLSELNQSKRNEIMEESEIILKDLSWDNRKGREYLLKEFNVSTRNELDEIQLISFVKKLKSIRDQYLSE